MNGFCESLYVINWSAVKDFVQTVATLATVFIAYLALNKWQSELRGKAHFEASRNLARAVFKFRDAVQNCRAPLIMAHEFEGIDPSSKSGTERADAYTKVFGKRFAPVRAALQEVDAATLEAEALWGSDIVKKVDALRDCAVSLSSAMYSYISNEGDLGSHFKGNKDFAVKMTNIVFASPGENDNAFTVRINTAVVGVEDVLKTHLKRE